MNLDPRRLADFDASCGRCSEVAKATEKAAGAAQDGHEYKGRNMFRSRVMTVLLAGFATVLITVTGAGQAMAKPTPGPEPVASRGLNAADEALLHRPAHSDAELRRQIALQLKSRLAGSRPLPMRSHTARERSS